MSAWLHIIGIGDGGLESLTPATRLILDQAQVIVGGKRHHALTQELSAERINWPSPFDHLFATLEAHRGKRIVVLVTGDPLWFSAGEKIASAFTQEDCVIHPQPSAFQFAASRMGWAMDHCDCLTLHGRAVQNILPSLTPDACLICLTSGADTPKEVAKLLTDHGFGPSKLTVLGHLGGEEESCHSALAQDWDQIVPSLNVLCVEVIAEDGTGYLPRTAGLPDSAFIGDGTMTKQDIRAITLAKLAPFPRQLLWDLGCGCGSVAIEWMRAAKGTQAIGVERRADRLTYAAENALRLGTPNLELKAGELLEIIPRLETPDAIFIGGGLTEAVALACLERLPKRGRLVANVVTLEGEAQLLALHAKHGGSLTRIAVSHAEPVGRLTGWRPAMPVTQWSFVK